MAVPTSAKARSLLADAVSVWRISPATVGDVIDAAVECLVAGIDSPSLRELAGASPKESQFALEPLISDALVELNMQEVLTADVQRAALGAMLRKVHAGQLEMRELAGWAHRFVGHDGDTACQAFVDLDDMYDDAEYSGRDLVVLEQWAADAARAFLAGEPLPPYSWS
ncbi:hypothetical protein [Nocardioides sp. MH1]|uniref:hypothetical protein n=1 Tax=Nocardioides sp. MH1 TaxID=3242490 RepID=UPI0035200F72